MKTLLKHGLSPIWLTLLAAWSLHAQERTFTFPLIDLNHVAYQAYSQAHDPLDLSRPDKLMLNRNLMEILMFQNALVLGGCGCRIRFVPYTTLTTNARSLVDLLEGRLLASPVAGFRSDPRMVQGAYVSEPLLDDDAFKVGIYTHESRADVLAIRDPERIRQLTFVVVESWEVDIRVLTEKKLRFIKAENWLSALRMLEAGRADAILQPFSSHADMSFEEPQLGLRFKPLPGVKMNFGHGRHYFVSRRFPEGAWFLERLNAGLRVLKSSGKLKEWLIASGVEDPRIRDFVEIP